MKTITNDDIAKVKRALYAAKLAVESGFDGQEKDDAIREIIEALDAISDAVAMNAVAAFEVTPGAGGHGGGGQAG
jgi:hypothetical protein